MKFRYLTIIFCSTTISIIKASLQELQTLYERKTDFIIQDYSSNFEQIPKWLTLYSNETGTWSDVDYTSGCPARRANWPAQQHFVRVVTMASQYRANMEENSHLIPYIQKAMDYWFDNNYTPDACLDQGGQPNGECPCGTPGFWNTNWFGQMILMPKLISNTCVLLKAKLTETQRGNCTLILQRVYSRIDTVLDGIGPMTGANMLDSATSVLNFGLVTDNETLVKDALNHFYNQTLITPGVGVDGVKIDGSYLQHFSQLYTGNYGKDFINSVVVAYIQTANTAYAPPPNSRAAFVTMINGTEWMIVANHTARSDNATLLWEYSVIGRMVSFAATDKQASGGVALNLTRIRLATKDWPEASKLQPTLDRLENLKTQKTGQGEITGTRSFFASDYLVHRDSKYVTTLKSFSRRTSNSECNNNQNSYGFHLSDGSIFTYIDGNEYSDIFAAWDWNLVPGTTVDYGATPLGCNITQFYGNTSFVGSVTPANSNQEGYSREGGMAVMHYMNPLTGSLEWEKTYYFFSGFYAVQIGPIIRHNKQGKEPIITTLDQSNLKSDVYVNGKKVIAANDGADYQTLITDFESKKQMNVDLWHNRILYTILNNVNYHGSDDSASRGIVLKVNANSHNQNDWSAIGISNGTATQKIFTATLEHPTTQQVEEHKENTAPLVYIAQINTKDKILQSPDKLVQFVHQEDGEHGKVRGAYNPRDETVALAFWTAGSIETPWDLSVTTNQPILLYFTRNKKKGKESSYTMTVADPTQFLEQVVLTVFNKQTSKKPQAITVQLPHAPSAGSSISINIA
ncbi:chondroitin AC/alginate lyase [Mycotypha africana]|uniref:chondroitin AC/alginate lyase n=1 Tax=Mycotypha africana TaxID=64632 RepID=UPI002301D1E7|nr:chondroitin AC/alginate lyase [Mycotypha africana]KAI8972037.1 chondroitin AC/alginate lyase [Mycotypha africana]